MLPMSPLRQILRPLTPTLSRPFDKLRGERGKMYGR
jgi:hypothetical protein